ncbi:MAG: hypothetical protein LBD31_02470 [Treponema sp.]|jgi:hypothetical protein|nr:hypothetical protein [Treponema sp.]
MGLLRKAAGDPPKGGSSAAKEKARKGLLSRMTKKRKEAPPEEKLTEILNSGYTRFGAFQGLVFEAAGSGEHFLSGLAAAVSGFGAVCPLGGGRCLVLFGAAQDGELLASHLVKFLPGKRTFTFRAESPRSALAFLKPLL